MFPDDVDTRAPAVARHSVVIDAPLGVLRRLHTDVDAWPKEVYRLLAVEPYVASRRRFE